MVLAPLTRSAKGNPPMKNRYLLFMFGLVGAVMTVGPVRPFGFDHLVWGVGMALVVLSSYELGRLDR
jgi:hypothetical protein